MTYNTIMKRPYRIVIDTNVFISALISKRGKSHKLFKMIGSHLFDVCISVPLIFEYEDVAKRSGKVGIRHEWVDDVLDYICAVGVESEIFYLWRPVLTDPSANSMMKCSLRVLKI